MLLSVLLALLSLPRLVSNFARLAPQTFSRRSIDRARGKEMITSQATKLPKTCSEKHLRKSFLFLIEFLKFKLCFIHSQRFLASLFFTKSKRSESFLRYMFHAHNVRDGPEKSSSLCRDARRLQLTLIKNVPEFKCKGSLG